MQKFQLCIKDKHNSFKLWERVRNLTLSFLDLINLILTQSICSNAVLSVLGNKGAFVHCMCTQNQLQSLQPLNNTLKRFPPVPVWTHQTCVADS